VATEGRPDNDRSPWRHPLLLAIVPVVVAAALARMTIFGGSDSRHGELTNVNTPSTRVSEGISFRVDRDFDAYKTGWAAAFEGELPTTAQLPADVTYLSLFRWASSRGAIDIETSHLRLYVQNDGAERVAIRSIKAEVLDHAVPASGSLIAAPPAGENELIDLRFDLTHGDLVDAMTPVSEESATLEPYFSKRNVSLDPGESTELQLRISADGCLCRYQFAIEVIKPDSTVTIEVRDAAGRPFLISGRAQAYREQWIEGLLVCERHGLFPMQSELDVDCDHPASPAD
jgi:hypothetical protein